MQTAVVTKRSAIVIAIAVALSSPMGAQSGHELFQQALSKERAEGKLHEAIALYQRVIDVAGTDHALAAKALLQLGRCYEALGNTEARAVYERLIARYPEQTNHVAQSIRGYLGSPYGGHGLGRRTLHWRARQIPYARTGRNIGPVWSPDGGRLIRHRTPAGGDALEDVVTMIR